MMIRLFDIQDKRVVPAESCHLVPELKAIMVHFPDEYLKIYQYIFGMTCPDGTNWYVNLDETLKENVIKADIMPYNFYIEDMLIEKALDKCRKLYETPTLRSWMGAKKMLDRIGKYLDENEITDGKDSNGLLIDRYMSKLGDYHDTYKKMDNELKKEQAKVRGMAKVPYHQLPGYVDTKADKEEIDE